MPEPIDYTYDDELESEIADRDAEALSTSDLRINRS